MSEIMWTELEKVDILRERMGVSYERARFALEANQGDLVKALAELEKEPREEDGLGRWFIDGVKNQMRRLNKTQLNLKREDKTLLSMSAPLGIALAYTIWKRPTLRMIGLLGAATAAVNHYELEVDSVEKPAETAEEYEEQDDEYPYDIKTVILPDEEIANINNEEVEKNEKIEISE